MEGGAVLGHMEHAAKSAVEVKRKDIVGAIILSHHTEERNVRDRQKKVLHAILKNVQVGNIMFSHNKNP